LTKKKHLTKDDKNLIVKILEDSNYQTPLCISSGRPTIYCQRCGIRYACPKIMNNHEAINVSKREANNCH